MTAQRFFPGSEVGAHLRADAAPAPSRASDLACGRFLFKFSAHQPLAKLTTPGIDIRGLDHSSRMCPAGAYGLLVSLFFFAFAFFA